MRKKPPPGDKKHPDEYTLVYSTDASVKTGGVVSRLGSLGQADAPRAQTSVPLRSLGRPRARIERKGRGGKTVTVISGLPSSLDLLEKLCGSLKKWIGCGGTFDVIDGQGVIELQGDRKGNVGELLGRYAQDHGLTIS